MYHNMPIITNHYPTTAKPKERVIFLAVSMFHHMAETTELMVMNELSVDS